jgi:hypothetical protein
MNAANDHHLRWRDGYGATPLLRAIALALLAGSAACASTSPDQAGVWGSDQASLTVAGSSATLRILAPGGCYGSYGQIDQRIPNGAFTLPGTYTQLMGAYPGKVEYAAQYSGTVAGPQLSLTVTVPALQQVFGPYQLAEGVARLWPACAYP